MIIFLSKTIHKAVNTGSINCMEIVDTLNESHKKITDTQNTIKDILNKIEELKSLLDMLNISPETEFEHNTQCIIYILSITLLSDIIIKKIITLQSVIKYYEIQQIKESLRTDGHKYYIVHIREQGILEAADIILNATIEENATAIIEQFKIDIHPDNDAMGLAHMSSMNEDVLNDILVDLEKYLEINDSKIDSQISDIDPLTKLTKIKNNLEKHLTGNTFIAHYKEYNDIIDYNRRDSSYNLSVDDASIIVSDSIEGSAGNIQKEFEWFDNPVVHDLWPKVQQVVITNRYICELLESFKPVRKWFKNKGTDHVLGFWKWIKQFCMVGTNIEFLIKSKNKDSLSNFCDTTLNTACSLYHNTSLEERDDICSVSAYLKLCKSKELTQLGLKDQAHLRKTVSMRDTFDCADVFFDFFMQLINGKTGVVRRTARKLPLKDDRITKRHKQHDEEVTK